MKRSIRVGVFETNSSSTHSLTVVSKEDFDRWANGEAMFDCYEDEIVEKREIDEDDYDGRYRFKSYSDFFYDNDLETYETTFKTKSGDEVVAFGAYGYDG